MTHEFQKFSSIPRLNKWVIVTEKIDGTNAQIHVEDIGMFRDSLPHTVLATSYVEETGACLILRAGSRNRYLTLDDDNFGFARWCSENFEELFKFGPGRHYGEWYGQGIQRGYGLTEKRLAMFNPRWATEGPSCVSTVPVLTRGNIADAPAWAMQILEEKGSIAVPGYDNPEGIVAFHIASRQMYKATFDYDEGKWSALEVKHAS